MTEIQTAIKNSFPDKRVVIVGDLVADQFLNGTISRVSREAPVFILRHDQTLTVPGAAANAAANIASLGAKPILIGAVGSDSNGKLLLEKLKDVSIDTDGVVTDTFLTTTTKVRVLAGQNYAARQQVIRIDYENTADLSEATKEQLCKNLLALRMSADAIIISDYNCGAFFPELYETALRISKERGIPLIVDSRYRLSEFSDANSATPNREEVEQILGDNFSIEDCAGLREKLGYEALLVTNGNKGMILIEKDKAPLNIDAIGSREPVDVTGAGDTVIAAYTLGLACGLSHADAARIANHAGGIVVMKKGTETVSMNELLISLSSVEESLVSRHAK